MNSPIPNASLEQHALAFGGLGLGIGEAAQHGNAVLRADLREPAADQLHARTCVLQRRLKAGQGLGGGTHAQGEAEQFVEVGHQRVSFDCK